MKLAPGAALLFDIDGTLADTDPLHLKAFNLTFEPYGHSFDKQRFTAELQGFANEAIMTRFVPQLPRDEQIAVMESKEALFRELAATEIHPVPGLFDLLDWADEHGVPMAAVTNAPRLNADLILKGLGIAHRFKALVIGGELTHGKPHPLPYLEGLRLLGARAEVSAAFEDSRTGVTSATAAGIATVGILTSATSEALAAVGAVMSTNRYDDPTLHNFIGKRLSGG